VRGNYPRKSAYDFGRALLEQKDLDPLYDMLYAAGLERPLLARYMLAYWCFYDTGTAAWVAYLPPPGFWARMREAAGSKRFPRGGDRRHFRGATALKSVGFLESLGETPERLLDRLSGGGKPTTLTAVVGRVRELYGFGLTISFKAADMLERLWGARYVFGPDDPLLFSQTPRAGALSLAEAEGWGDGSAEEEIVKQAHGRVLEVLGGYSAPPRFERKLTVLETETILCKWKHHLNGSYPVGRGKEAQWKGLPAFGRCPLSQRLYKAGRVAGLW
jgi:hypothetical protein